MAHDPAIGVPAAEKVFSSAHQPCRVRLPDRRLSVAATIEWNGTRWELRCGFDRAGQVREIFLDRGSRSGSDLARLVADSCVLASVVLQSGWSCAVLAQSLGRLSRHPLDGPDGDAASLIGLALARAIEIEAAEAANVAALYEAAAATRAAGA